MLLTNLTVAQAGGYTAWITNASGDFTNTRTAMLTVDPTFTKITTDPVATDLGRWGGPTWWDYDNDGFLDLYVPNAGVRDGVYHNKGDGTFSRVTNELNKVEHDYIAGAVGDYNNSGLASILLFHWNNLKEDLYRNNGSGNFTQLTPFNDYSPFSGGWADYDRDGFLDLFVANTGPSTIHDSLYRNNGDGTFTKMTASQAGGLVTDKDTTGPCVWVDYDNDGWPDLWVGAGLDLGGGIGGRQYLWHNNGDGVFSQVSGVSAGSLTNDCATAFAQWADYDNDGYPDVFLGAEWYGTSSLHHNVGGRTFTDVSTAAGVPHVMKTIGATWGDYDNDGYLDLMVAAFFAADRSILYHNNGDGTFTSVDVGSPLRDGVNRQGAAWADYDNDGFLDLLITYCRNNVTEKKLLYHNNGNSNTWLEVKLVAKASNQSAIGAKVRVQATIRGQKIWQMREINGNSAYSGGACGLLAHFGLGDATNVTTLRIEWPSGIVQELPNVAANQFLPVVESQAYIPTNARPAFTGATKDASDSLLSFTEPAIGASYILEASTNLVTWTKLLARTSAGVTTNYTDTRATNYPSRFYRLQVP